MSDLTVPNEQLLPQAPRVPLPLELQIYFDESVYQRVSIIAKRMANAQGVTPKHLLGKEEACFFVVEAALTWRLRPMAVAKATYQTPGGEVGYMAVLINAIIEASGRLEPGTGGVRFDFFGDWSHVLGKYETKQSEKGKYQVATWTDSDAAKGGCGVTISARLRGEKSDRDFSMRLTQAFPRNSTLWASDPQTQLVYLATRRFANLRMPGVLMGFRDPINDTAIEHDMGEADVIREQEMVKTIETPAAVDIVVDKETGEVKPAVDKETVTQGALGVLNSKLDAKNLHETFCDRYDIIDASELPMSKVTEALAWIDSQK